MNARYKNKRIAVLGAGDSGEAAAILLAEEGAMVTVLDSAEESKLRAKIDRLSSLGITLIAGTAAEKDTASYDLGVISPGIDPAVPLVRNFVGRKIDMLGELEISYDLCACPVIAITGTNGKTTTTELVARMLTSSGVRTLASGNIGPAFAATVKKSAGMDVMTLEVSSFQLEQIRNFRPRVAVWLNLTPDHLDRYASMEEYRAAKLRIFENQTPEDFAVVNLRDDLPPLAAKRITFSAYAQGGDFEFCDGVIYHHGLRALKMSDANLRGLHNVENLMAALGVGFAMGLPFEKLVPALCSYKALPHRCELVRELDGVAYVNDSKATNLDALEKALLSETRPVVLIAGGKDKGFEFDSITALVAQKARTVILIGEMSDRIADCWHPGAHCEKAPSLADAVEMARTAAQSGAVVLFSPGTSSFDMFKNYAARGNQFRAIVQALTTS